MAIAITLLFCLNFSGLISVLSWFNFKTGPKIRGIKNRVEKT